MKTKRDGFRWLLNIRKAVAAELRKATLPSPRGGPRGGFRWVGDSLIKVACLSCGRGEKAVIAAFRHCSSFMGDIEIRVCSWQATDALPTNVEVRLRTRGVPRRTSTVEIPLNLVLDAGAREVWLREREDEEKQKALTEACNSYGCFLRLAERFARPEALSDVDRAAIAAHGVNDAKTAADRQGALRFLQPTQADSELAAIVYGLASRNPAKGERGAIVSEITTRLAKHRYRRFGRTYR